MSEKPRIMLWHWGRRGGGPLYTLELGRALKRRGNVVVSLSLSRQADIYAAAAEEGLAGYSPDTYTGTLSAIASVARIPGIARAFRSALAAEGIGTVVSTMPSLWTPMMLSAALANDRRYISVIHDAETHQGERHPGRKAAQSRDIQAAAAVVALSQHVARDIARIYGYPYQRIQVIPHGIFAFGSVPSAHVFPETRPFRFLLFGRLLAYKGLDLLADAIDQLPQDLSVEIHIAGSGHDSATLKRLAGHSLVKLDHRWIPEEELATLLQSADAVLAPYNEASQSGVIAAAYGAGLPVIATPVGGLVEQIEPYGSGLVSTDASPRSFARAMAKLASEKALYERLSAAAMAVAEGPFGWNSIAAQFETLIAPR